MSTRQLARMDLNLPPDAAGTARMSQRVAGRRQLHLTQSAISKALSRLRAQFKRSVVSARVEGVGADAVRATPATAPARLCSRRPPDCSCKEDFVPRHLEGRAHARGTRVPARHTHAASAGALHERAPGMKLRVHSQ